MSTPGRQSSNAVREFDVLRQAMTGGGVLALFDAPWTPIYILVCFMLHPALGGLATVGAVILLGLAVLNERATKKLMQRPTRPPRAPTTRSTARWPRPGAAGARHSNT